MRPDSSKLVLMDNNILAADYGISQLEGLIGSGYAIDLNQGMDARLVTDGVARILAQIKWIRFIRFSCDHRRQMESVVKAIELLEKYGKKPYHVFVYLLITPDLEDASYRVESLKRFRGIHLYAQPERNAREMIIPNALQKEFAQRYIYGKSYRKETWQEYLFRWGYLERLKAVN